MREDSVGLVCYQKSGSIHIKGVNANGNMDEGYTLSNGSDALENYEIKFFAYSPEGKYLCIVHKKGLLIYDTLDFFQPLHRVEKEDINNILFSPASKYICVTVNRSTKKIPDEKDGDGCNLVIYALVDMRETIRLLVNNLSCFKLEWFYDERMFVIFVIGRMCFYNMGDSGYFSLGDEHVSGDIKDFFMCSSGGRTSIITMSKTKRPSTPVFIKMFCYPNLKGPVSMASTFKADYLEVEWNTSKHLALIVAHTNEDGSKKSYYGESSLMLLTTLGKSVLAVLDKEGPIYDVKWCPGSTKFVVIYGFVPSKVAVFNTKCEVVHTLGEMDVNKISFNPAGNILCLAGFGSLPGDVYMFDKKGYGLFAHIKAANTTIYQWSPDGKHLLLGTHYKRLKEDNGYTIYDYKGKDILSVSCKEGLVDVKWAPTQEPATPFPIEKSKDFVLKKKCKYVPPALRNK